MSKENKTVDLLDFKWDDPIPQEFKDTVEFEEIEERDEKIEQKEKEKEENKKEDKETKNAVSDDDLDNPDEDGVEIEEGDDDFFEEEEIEDNTEEQSSNVKELAEKMKSAGILSVEFEPDEIEDEEDLIALQQKEINKRIDEELSNFAQQLGNEGQAFIKFVKEGGNPQDFFNVLQNTVTIPTYRENDENNNERVIKYYLENIKEIDDPDDIEETIEMLKEKGKLEAQALKYSKKLEEIKQEQLKRIEQENLQRAKQQEELRKQFEENITNKLEELDEYNGIEITDKKALKDYIFKPVKRNGKNYVSKFTEDLQGIFNEPEKLIAIAQLLKNDLDLSFIEKKLETKVTKKTKEKINKYSVPKGTKDLTDYF